MRRQLSVAVMGIVAAGLMFVTPLAAQAQCNCGGHGTSPGGGGFPGYNNNFKGYSNSGHSPSFGGYSNSPYSRGHGGYSRSPYLHSHDGHGGRGFITHPTSIHWTPYQGLHTHGHIHVPHGSHSHVIRY